MKNCDDLRLDEAERMDCEDKPNQFDGESLNKNAGREMLDRRRQNNFQSSQLGEQLVIGLVLFEGRSERFHGFNRIQVHHHAAEFA